LNLHHLIGGGLLFTGKLSPILLRYKLRPLCLQLRPLLLNGGLWRGLRLLHSPRCGLNPCLLSVILR
jgi:hypothetical protein